MKEIKRVGFVCVGETALELSSAICCAGRFMRLFTENGYMTGGCYSCISPSKQTGQVRSRILHMCACNDVVITVGCDGFRQGDVIPDIIETISTRTLSYFACKLSSEYYADAVSGKEFKCFPSRSTAVITGKTLLLSVPSDLTSSLGKLSSLLPSITYAVGGAATGGENPLEMSNLMQDFFARSAFHD